ncbi:MAG TPA: recombinase family protein, partial [Alphaproteobacteria bacterium]|nr:recombinase family protein [Alphaproteobacteria bacterium]
MSENIVIYARFSSHNQNEQSIEGQLKACHSFAALHDFVVIQEYVDRAISGTTDKRPEFLRMVEDSKQKRFKYVLVYQLDRFARNRYDSATYKAKLKKNGVRVLSAKENITDDASGILIEGVLESMAEYYSAELSQKIKRGMQLNAEKCLATGGNVALGFCVDESRHFQINEEEAHIVNTIFQMYASGSTMADIVRYLNDHQIKTSRGNEYNKCSLRRILTNKRYIGIYTFGDKEVKDGLPRIISDELFNEVQQIMEKNKKAPARSKAKAEYILTTKLFCGYCQSMMTGLSGAGQSGKKYYYYSCVQARKNLCSKKVVSKNWIEDLVVSETHKLLTSERINLIAKEVVALTKRESNTTELNRLKRLLSENEKATCNLIKALEQGKAVDVIAGQIQARQQEKLNLENAIAEESSKYPVLSVQEVRFFLHQLQKGDINDMKYRKTLV